MLLNPVEEQLYWISGAVEVQPLRFGSEDVCPRAAVRAVERFDPLNVITTIHRSSSNIAPDIRASGSANNASTKAVVELSSALPVVRA
jgi:hypothetical protein